MKKIYIVVFLFLTVRSISQVWCYPGAEWYYTRNWMTGNGFAKHSYVGDVVFQSQNCQKITYYSEYYTYLGNTTGTMTSTYYTYVNNNVVYLWFSGVSQFDTLVNFNAVPGNAWYLPYDSNCGYKRWQVLDTRHHIIQGQNLKWLRINGDTIYERIGNLYYYAIDLPPSCLVDIQYGGPLRCYSDNQITNFKRYANNCDYYNIPSGTKEYSSFSKLSVSPNPFTNQLIINSQLKDLILDKITIVNTLGQTVLELRRQKTNEPFHTELPKGLYMINFELNGQVKSLKVIKE